MVYNEPGVSAWDAIHLAQKTTDATRPMYKANWYTHIKCKCLVSYLLSISPIGLHNVQSNQTVHVLQYTLWILHNTTRVTVGRFNGYICIYEKDHCVVQVTRWKPLSLNSAWCWWTKCSLMAQGTRGTPRRRKNINTLIALFMGPTWGPLGSCRPIWVRQDPSGPHVGPMNFAIWVVCPEKNGLCSQVGLHRALW